MRQTERRARTRAALLRAALAAFAEKGYEGASIDTIAAAAGLSKGAVYANFPNKLDLYLAVIDSVADAAEERFGRVAHLMSEGQDPLRAARGFFRQDDDSAHVALMAELWTTATEHSPARSRLEQYIERRRLAFSQAAADAGHPPAEALRLAATVERLIDAEVLYRRLGRGADGASVS